MTEINTENINNENNEEFSFDINKLDLTYLLSLPDDKFQVIAPLLLEEYQMIIDNAESRDMLIQSLNEENIKIEDVIENLEEILNDINSLDFISSEKRDFIKKLLVITTNNLTKLDNVPHRILTVPIQLIKDTKKPSYIHINDAGADVYAPEDIDILPGETKLIPLGFKVDLPNGYAFLIHPRSGMSLKTKMRISNSIGLCDAGFKDEYGLIVDNIESKIKNIDYDFNDKGEIIIKSIEEGSAIHIDKGDRIAQLRLVEVPTAKFVVVENIENVGDDRNGGFGSTGTK